MRRLSVPHDLWGLFRDSDEGLPRLLLGLPRDVQVRDVAQAVAPSGSVVLKLWSSEYREVEGPDAPPPLVVDWDRVRRALGMVEARR